MPNTSGIARLAQPVTVDIVPKDARITGRLTKITLRGNERDKRGDDSGEDKCLHFVVGNRRAWGSWRGCVEASVVEMRISEFEQLFLIDGVVCDSG